MGFLLDRLGMDCPKLQYLRELTQNSIEAFTRNPQIIKDRQIVWTRDDIWYEASSSVGTPQSKLCIIDNGVGMSPDEMESYVNALSSSGGIQSFHGNYGIGAKIAAATYHPQGVIYQSWKDGKGFMIHLWKDTKTGAYGLKEFEPSNTPNPYVFELDASHKPAIIDQHGTKVILLGTSIEDNTFIPPDEISTWVPRYLNSRYFKLPAGIDIKFEAIQKKDNRSIVGMYQYLESKKVTKGIVKMSSANAHWYILPKGLGDSRAFLDKGHVGVIHQNELYDVHSGKKGIGKLSTFGVIFGANRVIIYVEPHSTVEIHTNTSRSGLHINGEPLPWEDWATEFCKSMPKELEELQAEERGDDSGTKMDDIKRLLSSVRSFFELSKMAFKKGAGNTSGVAAPETDDSDEVTAGNDGDIGAGGGANGRRGGSGRSRNFNNPYVKFDPTKPGDDHSGKLIESPLPKVQWIDDPAAYGLEGLAATYHQSGNTIVVNRQFGGFLDLKEKLSGQVSLNQAVASKAIQSSIEKWYELSLIEAVIGVYSLKNLAKWNTEQVSTALSPEALTSICMQRYYPVMNIKREIGKFKLVDPAVITTEVSTATMTQ